MATLEELNAKIEELIRRIKAENKQLREERDDLRNRVVSAEDGENYYRAIFDGSWPQAIEILERTLVQVKAKDAERKE